MGNKLRPKYKGSIGKSISKGSPREIPIVVMPLVIYFASTMADYDDELPD